MSPYARFVLCRFGCPATAIALVLYGSLAASAQTVAPGTTAVGRIDFEQAKLPPATVEVELGPGMIGDLLGLGKAAIAGVAETLIQSPQGTETTKLAAEQLIAVQEIVQIASEVVKEVRVRVYEDSPTAVGPQLTNQMRTGQWNTVVRVNDGDESIELSLVHQEGVVRGAFVNVKDGNDLVLVNVVCDISPEKIKALTSKAAQIGLDNGLQQMIEGKLEHLQRHHHHDQAHAPESQQANF